MTVGPGYGQADMPRAQMRASTADRDRAVELVTRAYTEGRLDKADRTVSLDRFGPYADVIRALDA